MAADEKDFRLDISSLAGQEQGGKARPAGVDKTTANAGGPGDTAIGRPYLSVQFSCCKIYTRIYRCADGKSYRGRCPRCGLPVSFVVGAGGTDARVFVVE